jgi:hypothetical protein
MYKIRVDRKSELIEVTLGEMMSLDAVSNYITELKRQATFYKLQSYALVIDVTHCPVEAQEMIRSMGQHMVTMPKARALAVVTESALARMQVRRLFTQPYARIAGIAAEGRGWVLYGTERDGVGALVSSSCFRVTTPPSRRLFVERSVSPIRPSPRSPARPAGSSTRHKNAQQRGSDLAHRGSQCSRQAEDRRPVQLRS